MGDYGIDFMGDTLMFIAEVPKVLREGGWHLLLFGSRYLSQQRYEEASPPPPLPPRKNTTPCSTKKFVVF